MISTTLIDAFKSTLDEELSDLILHIRDISNSNYLEQKKDVLKILTEIGIDMNDERILDVINKEDLIKSEKVLHNSLDKNSIYISALKGNGIENLKKIIFEKII